jgi:hypothetical protein
MRRALGTMSLQPPQGWSERSMFALEAPRGLGARVAPSVVVVHETLAPGETVTDFVRRHLAQHGLMLIGARFLEIGETLAFQATCDLAAGYEDLERTITFIESEDGTDSIVTYISTTCSKVDAAALRPIFDAMLASVRLGAAGLERLCAAG